MALLESNGGDDRPRLGFKDKLLASLNDAGAQQILDQAAHEEVGKGRQQLCIEALVEGHPQAFVELFLLTHRPAAPPPDPDALPGEAGAAVEEEVPAESLGLLKQTLVMVEQADRGGDPSAVYAAFQSLADHFELQNLHQLSIQFHQRCLKVAIDARDAGAELEANLKLGLAHEQAGNTAGAIRYHERHRELATSAGDEEATSQGHYNLVRVYQQHSEETEERGDLGGAVELLLKGMEAAKAAGDSAAEGLANYELGLACQKLGEPDRALTHLGTYMAMCQSAGDKVGEGAACCALAAVHQDLGDVDAAVTHLEAFLELAKNGDPEAQARACCSLGVIYTRQAKYERAVTYLEKFFELARSLGDRRLLDIARVNLGIARGAARTRRFMEVVNGSMASLLLFKNVRTPLDTL